MHKGLLVGGGFANGAITGAFVYTIGSVGRGSGDSSRNELTGMTPEEEWASIRGDSRNWLAVENVATKVGVIADFRAFSVFGVTVDLFSFSRDANSLMRGGMRINQLVELSAGGFKWTFVDRISLDGGKTWIGNPTGLSSAVRTNERGGTNVEFGFGIGVVVEGEQEIIQPAH